MRVRWRAERIDAGDPRPAPPMPDGKPAACLRSARPDAALLPCLLPDIDMPLEPLVKAGETMAVSDANAKRWFGVEGELTRAESDAPSFDRP